MTQKLIPSEVAEALSSTNVSLVNPLAEVRKFMRNGGCTTDSFNPAQATLYVGLVLEEVAEMILVIADNAVHNATKTSLQTLSHNVESAGSVFKRGEFQGCVMRAHKNDGAELLDAMIDIAWVATGAALSTSTNTAGAFAEVARANNDKFGTSGVCVKDANGKIVKPANWRGPDLSPFVAKIDD